MNGPGGLGGPAGRDAVFAKTLDGAPDGFFTAGAEGLRLLAPTRTVAVPEVRAADRHTLVVEWARHTVPGRAAGPRTGRAARRAGRFHGHHGPGFTTGSLFRRPLTARQ
ncbi:hypothetical protein ABZ883_11830 [Streptomyces sp. NPDC046977]|uniref:hypothetical protein n=1 Tax=Streptomyces sp. NPDC046977 TaxID=3154703 RepID=UPI0034017F60